MKFVVTAGGTSERIDQVRNITNSSSGKLGKCIAEEILKTMKDSDELYYICSKNAYRPEEKKVHILEVFDTKDLEQTVRTLLSKQHIDYFIHSMAVSDYTVQYVTNAYLLKEEIMKCPKKDVVEVIKQNESVLGGSKISSNQDHLMILLKPTPKIISMIKGNSPETYLVGFKLLDGVKKEELFNAAIELKERNHCSFVVANDLKNIREGQHLAYIIEEDNSYEEVSGKEEIAKTLVKKMLKGRDYYG